MLNAEVLLRDYDLRPALRRDNANNGSAFDDKIRVLQTTYLNSWMQIRNIITNQWNDSGNHLPPNFDKRKRTTTLMPDVFGARRLQSAAGRPTRVGDMYKSRRSTSKRREGATPKRKTATA